VEIREYTPDDVDDVARIRRLAFGGPADADPQRHVAPGRRGLIAELEGRPSAVLSIADFAQFFGGAPVPMGGVAGVAVDPHTRGRGVATALLDSSLRTMREHGQVISVLYATVPNLYRGRGWERSGVLEWLDFPMDRLLMSPKPEERQATRPAAKGDLDALHDCYLRLASTVDGMLDRHAPTIEIGDVLGMDVVTVVPGEDGTLRGYLTAERPAAGGLKVHDLVAADRDTQLTLLRELTSWAGVLDQVSLRVTDPAVAGLVTAQAMRHTVRNAVWLQRVVDLPAAVAARGWPNAVALRPSAVDVYVLDEHAPWHAGAQRIVAEDGVVRVEPGGTGVVRLHARALGPWFSGMQNTHALRRAGLLEGDPADAALLDVLTGSPGVPRLADFF
jgi:predicted acetyltransferase